MLNNQMEYLWKILTFLSCLSLMLLADKNRLFLPENILFRSGHLKLELTQII